MNILITAGIALITAVASVFGVYNYLPLSVLQPAPEARLGSSITTIDGSDTLSSSRAVINTNFSNLNSTKIENSTTSVASITTLANLATIGTITSGIWNGTAIGVSKGGTGTTTPTSNQLMIGDGSSGFKVIGFGSSGQFLTSAGASTVPSWTTGSVDQAGTYTWTGANMWTASTTHTATTSISASSVTNNALTLNGLAYAFPSTRPTFPSVFRDDGTGVLTLSAGVPRYTYSTTTDSVTFNTHATTTTFAIPAVLTASSTITIHVNGTCDDDTGGAGCTMRIRNTAGAEFISCTSSVGTGLARNISMDFKILANNSTSAQTAYCVAANNENVEPVDSTSSIDTSSGLNLVGVFHTGNVADSFNVGYMSVIVEP